MSRLVLAAILLCSGCASYDPPVIADRTSVKYQADLVRCRKQASTAASKKANATPQSAVAAMFNSGDQERQDLVACLHGRGYPLQAGT